ncbi:MAG: hypothetical protein ACXVCD_19070 [Pseudobdellovibrionaceae bacterium]
MKNKLIPLLIGMLSATPSFGRVLETLQVKEVKGTRCANINVDKLCSRLVVPSAVNINGIELSPYYSLSCVIEGTFTEDDHVYTVSHFVPIAASYGVSAALSNYHASIAGFGSTYYGWRDFQEVDENCILNGTLRMEGYGALKPRYDWRKTTLAQSTEIEEAINTSTGSQTERSPMEIISSFITSGFNSDVLYKSKSEQECASAKQKIFGAGHDGLRSLAQCEINSEKGQWRLVGLWPYDIESPKESKK